MGWFDKAKKAVEAAKDEIEEATTEEIEYQQCQGYMRGSKDEPLASGKEKKDDN